MQEPHTLRQATRAFLEANRLLNQAQREDHDPFVIENRKEDVRRYEALIEQLRERTTTLVLTGEDDYSYDEDFGDTEAIMMLLQKGIIYECLSCEEREDLDDCYNGDHREFHLSGDHHEPCIAKALHEYDPTRWPIYGLPDEDYLTCEECGIDLLFFWDALQGVPSYGERYKREKEEREATLLLASS